MRTKIQSMLWGVASLLVARAAFAACVPTDECLMPQDLSTFFTPARDCLSLRTVASQCDCELEIWVKNTCAEALTANGFVWDGANPYDDTSPLVSIPKGSEGKVMLRALFGDTAGYHKRTRLLRSGSSDVTLTLEFVFARPGMQLAGGCQAAAASRAGFLTALLAVAVLWRRRARGF
jgi:hypothetical protein